MQKNTRTNKDHKTKVQAYVSSGSISWAALFSHFWEMEIYLSPLTIPMELGSVGCPAEEDVSSPKSKQEKLMFLKQSSWLSRGARAALIILVFVFHKHKCIFLKM